MAVSRCSSSYSSLAKLAVNLSAVFALVLLISADVPLEERQISVYSNIANYSLPVTVENAHDYVGIFELLEPLGKVSLKTSGTQWNLHYNDLECDFQPGSDIARLQDQPVPLGMSFVLRNGRGLVPLSSLTTLLPKLLGGPVNFHQAGRRLFIGDAGVHFTAQIRNTPPDALEINFTARVNPAISTEPGKLMLVFVHDPVLPPGTPVLTFSSRAIISASFSEENGSAEITIAASVPLFASFSNNGKTITVQPAPQQPPPVQSALKTAPSQQTLQPTAPASHPAYSRYYIVVDAAHGGAESGATLGNQLAEKDVTLAFARRLRDELEVRNVPVMLLRDSDAALTTDQRASTSNQLHPAIYLCIHASTDGRGVRLYTALVPSGVANRGPFLDWRMAQAPFLSSSQSAANTIAMELEKSHIPVRALSAPLRPLNSIAAAAVAVEIAPPAAGPSDLTATAYVEFVANSIAAGIQDLYQLPGAAR
jgi:N-acetylmuramoyl-L-alanine amidase